MSNSALLKSSLAKKYWMAFTGLFLILFLFGHLLGNLQLLISDTSIAKDQFNEYALFMTSNPLIKLFSYLTYASLLFHAIDGMVLVFQNKAARGEAYVKYKGSANAKWSSRNMGFLGTTILVFLIIHMKMYWAEYKFGELQHYETASGKMVKDLYTLTIQSFQDSTMGIFWVWFYALSMLALGYHLSHGYASACQSLGINHPKLNGVIKKKGVIISFLVPLAFAIIPFYIRYVL